VLLALEGGDKHSGSDYAVRRYVDDYFVFTNDEKLAGKILDLYQMHLEQFKMHLNESKKEEMQVPFVTGITIARVQLFNLFEEFFASVVNEEASAEPEEDPQAEDRENARVMVFRSLSRPGTTSNRVIRDIKCIVKSEKVDYSAVTSISFHSMKRHLDRIYNRTKPGEWSLREKKNCQDVLLATLDIVFFLYSMDYRTAATHKVAQIIVMTNRYLKGVDEEVRQTVLKKIFDEAKFLITNVNHQDRGLAIELLNLFVALRDLGGEYSLEPELLASLLDNGAAHSEKMSYFHRVVLLYYINNDEKYSEIKVAIERDAIAYFQAVQVPSMRSEPTLLFLDMIRCPFVSLRTKNRIIDLVYKKTFGKKPLEHSRNEVRNYICARDWFINWAADIELDAILLKKEVSSPY